MAENKKEMSTLDDNILLIEKLSILNYYMLKAIIINQSGNNIQIKFDNDTSDEIVKKITLVINEIGILTNNKKLTNGEE